VALVPPTEALRRAVDELREQTSLDWQLSDGVVAGTSLHVVYVKDHDMPGHYGAPTATLGFRVPTNCPDGQPEDAFFLLPANLELRETEPTRSSKAINRAASTPNVLQGVFPDNPNCLVFSWHLWNTVPWDRRKNTLLDHYGHCLRRFEQPEFG
jgi:hypothetical protein